MRRARKAGGGREACVGRWSCAMDKAVIGSSVAGWIREHDVREIECLIPDMNGVLRGKVLPAQKFLKAIDGGALYMPTSALLVCADGNYSGSSDEGFAYGDPDMLVVP